MSPQQAHLLVGHSVTDRLDDIIQWVDGNRACIWVDKDVSDLREARAEIDRLRCALRAVRACTDPKWQAQLISDALRETP
jgi:predicted RNase H-like nuclease